MTRKKSVVKFNPSVMQRIAAAPLIYFILDCDGTLTPIVRQPSLARLKAKTKIVLRELSRLPGVRVAIVSGRSLSSLEKLFGLKGLHYVGNHGLEYKHLGVLKIDSAVAKLRGLIAQLAAQLKRAVKEIPGAMVEDKIYGVCVHYRNVASKHFSTMRRIFQKEWKRFPQKHFFKVSPGKKIWEIRPKCGCSDKGKAVRFLRQCLPKSKRDAVRLVCIGDDRTDEDAFKVLKSSDFAIRVGYSSKTHARYWVKSSDDALLFLEEFLHLKKGACSRDVQR